MTTVSGQFIIYNDANNQYYIDVDKIVDYDEKIKQKAGGAPGDKVSQSIGKRPHSLKLYGRRRNGRYFQMLCITMIFVSLGNLYPPWRVAFLKSQGDG